MSTFIQIQSGGGSSITVVANYSALPTASTVSGKFYWCSNSQGTSWLPGPLGGSYYPNGMYYSNGTTWEFIDVPYQATQLEVDAGTVTDKFVTPKTLNDSAQLAAKADITPRVQSVTSSATVTATNLNDIITVTAQATGLTLNNPTGTFVEGQSLIFRIKDNGTARSIAYDTKFRAIGVTLPTTTVISKTTYLGCIYNSTDDRFDIIGVCTEV